MPLLAVLLVAALASGCGGDKESSSAPKATTTAGTSPEQAGRGYTRPAGKPRSRPAGKPRLVRNPRRAVIERSVEQFVGSVERSDAGSVCRLLGRRGGTIEGCAGAAGIDLRMLPSTDELSIARIAFEGSRARAGLTGGGTFTLRRAGRRWLITGFRP